MVLQCESTVCAGPHACGFLTVFNNFVLKIRAIIQRLFEYHSSIAQNIVDMKKNF